ncbi:hypothetical protein T492DRAFT_1032925 [Pavlovales sp. CCMP2436]|nr:hypothetical protein T492DRAFT_1032925 [Pavlovales sp. CCMP2436]
MASAENPVATAADDMSAHPAPDQVEGKVDDKETPDEVNVDPPLVLPDTVDGCAARGRELLKGGKMDDAIACLSKALELSVTKHGPLAEQCAESYYAYASVLLEKAQSESDPFGDVVRKIEDPGEGDKDTEGEDCAEPAAKPAPAAGGAGGSGAGLSGGDEESDDEGEEGAEAAVDDLQVAWECFETARLLFAKTQETDPHARRRLADCLLGLADIRLENEDLEGAAADYSSALEILTSILEPHDRTLSHAHYQLGVAHQQAPAGSAGGAGGSKPAEPAATESGGFGKPQLPAAGSDGAVTVPVSVLSVRRKAPQPGGAQPDATDSAASKKQRISLA